MKKLNIEEENREKLKKFIGPPLINSFKEFYNLDNETANKAVQYFREYFSEKGVLQNFLYEGIDDLLAKLKSKNFKLFVATSKPTTYAKQILNNLSINHLFIDIIGSNLDNSRTDKTEIIKYILDKHQLNNKECIMIGDRKFDINGAKNNSMLSVGVAYGHGSIKEFQESEADFIVDNCIDIFNTINKLP